MREINSTLVLSEIEVRISLPCSAVSLTTTKNSLQAGIRTNSLTELQRERSKNVTYER